MCGNKTRTHSINMCPSTVTSHGGIPFCLMDDAREYNILKGLQNVFLGCVTGSPITEGAG